MPTKKSGVKHAHAPGSWKACGCEDAMEHRIALLEATNAELLETLREIAALDKHWSTCAFATSNGVDACDCKGQRLAHARAAARAAIAKAGG